MTTYVPIIDISHHQGRIDFATMKRQGVRGLILRISNGDTLDKRAADYYPAAVAAGFDPSDLLWYVFVNPKRCSADRCVAASVEYIRSITGRDDTAIMWDFEHFDREAGTRGPGTIRGAEYANYARSLIAGVDRLAPTWRQFAYSNAAFWDHWVGSHGDDIVDLLDWIVPRYPVHSTAGYARYPLPGVDGWVDWAFARAHEADRSRLLERPPGPFPPRGIDWSGWQFSADHNGQGPVYGCQSSALDLNIVRADAWDRWTASLTPEPPEIPDPENDMDTLPQRRVTDTRGDGANYDTYKCRPNTQHTIRIPESKGYKAAQVTITAVQADNNGHLTVWRDGDRPATSMLNYERDAAPVADTLFVELDDAGAFQLWTFAGIHLIVDFTGLVAR